MWLFVCSTFGTLATIYFIVNLSQHLDADYFYSNSLSASETRKSLLSSIYVIMGFTVLNILVSIGLRKYIKVWIYQLYGITIPEYFLLSKI